MGAGYVWPWVQTQSWKEYLHSYKISFWIQLGHRLVGMGILLRLKKKKIETKA